MYCTIQYTALDNRLGQWWEGGVLAELRFEETTYQDRKKIKMEKVKEKGKNLKDKKMQKDGKLRKKWCTRSKFRRGNV
jgi:hypothetical protein